MQLFIKTQFGKTLMIKIDANALIADLKALIQEQQGFPVDSQTIVCMGRQMINEKTLTEEHVQDEFCMHLIFKSKHGISIFLKTPTGKIVVIDADPTDNIHSIKTKVIQKEGTPINQQEIRFFNSQKPFEDYKTLQQCGISTSTLLQIHRINQTL